MSKFISFLSMVFLIAVIAFCTGLYSAYSDGAAYRFFKESITALTAQSKLEKSVVPPNFIAKAVQRDISRPAKRFTTLDQSSDEAIVVAGGVGHFQDICGAPGCLAVAYNRSGEVVHSWPMKTDQLLEDTFGEAGEYAHRSSNKENDIYPVGIRFFDNGDILVNLNIRNAFPYGWGLARISPTGDVVWRRADYYHHWAGLDENGIIYSPFYEIRSGERYRGYQPYGRPYLICPKPRKQYADLLHILSPGGEVLQKIDLLELVGQDKRYNYLLSRTGDRCDPLHLNFAHAANKTVASKVPWLDEGDIVLSMRAISAVMVISADGSQIKRAYTGSFSVQHSAQFSNDGKIYMFDNMGASERSLPSRIVSIDLISGQEDVVYSRPESDVALAEFAQASGNLDVSSIDNRALVAYSTTGHLTEIDMQEGKVISVFENWHEPSEDYTGLYKIYGAWYVPEGFVEKLN